MVRGLSIGILNYNGQGILRRCLEAVQMQELPVPLDIFVVDNQSTDGSWKEATCRVVRGTNAHQFITGLNTVFEAARFEMILFLENDVFLHPGCAVQLWRALSDHPRAILQPVVMNPDGSYNHIGGGYGWPGVGYGYRRFYARGVLQPVPACATSCFLMTRETFTRVGPFDVNLAPAYYEDVDYSLRAQRLGIPRLVHTQAAATHVSNFSFSRVWAKPTLSAFCRRNRRYLVRKYHTGVDRWLRLAALRLADGVTSLTTLHGDTHRPSPAP